ncbi:hypothetical protein GCM10023192_33160 [Amycolatopsis samaneae]
MLKDAFGALSALKASFSAANALKASFSTLLTPRKATSITRHPQRSARDAGFRLRRCHECDIRDAERRQCDIRDTSTPPTATEKTSLWTVKSWPVADGDRHRDPTPAGRLPAPVPKSPARVVVSRGGGAPAGLRS